MAGKKVIGSTVCGKEKVVGNQASGYKAFLVSRVLKAASACVQV